MKKNRQLLLMLGFLLWTLIPNAVHAQTPGQVEIQAIPVGSGIYMLIGRGGNICISSGEDGVFMIDDQYAPLTGKIKATVAKITPKPIRFVINTHWHGDHTGGNENLGGEGAAIIAHENVRKRLSVDQVMGAMGRTVPALSRKGLPIITFTRDIAVHLNGQDIAVFHVANAHTDGDAFVHFRQANVLHTGDVLFMGLYPFIDIEHGGSIDGMIRAVEQILGKVDDKTRIIPGHGPLSDRNGLIVYRDMLISIRGRIKSQIDAGMGLDEIVSSRPTRDFDETWGGGFIGPDALVTTVYQSLMVPVHH